MKIRNGFVSNSSSSSFCIYGVYPLQHNIKQIDEDGEELSNSDKYDEIYTLAGKNNLECHSMDSYDDYFYVGKNLACCPDNMTMGEFKQQVKSKIEELFGPQPDTNYGIYEETYYN